MKRRFLTLHVNAAITISRIASWWVRKLGMGDGAALPGRILLWLRPGAITELSRGLPAVLISGTNAKTTTTALAREALAGSFQVISNDTGANMESGLAYALTRCGGVCSGKALGIFEVDEAYLPLIGRQLETKIVALLNLSRDQLDRVSETRLTSAKWRAYFQANKEVKVVANCDDPLVVYAANGASNILWISAGINFFQDARSCPECGEEIHFTTSDWRCTCGFERPIPDIEVFENEVEADGRRIKVELALPGRCNVSNAAIALGICQVLGVDLASAVRRMSYVSEVAGRYRRLSVDGRTVRMLLSKNPAGWLEVLDIVRDDRSVVVAINAQVADGRDPSWLWDVPFEFLQGKEVVASGERAFDLSVRLHYAGVEHSVIKDPIDAVKSCVNSELSFVGNYTSFQELRKRIDSSRNRRLARLHRLGDRISL